MKKRKNRNSKVEMICNVAELANLFHQGQNISSFLKQVVSTISSHMDTDVCSIYLYNESRDYLVLQASAGLNPEIVGKLILKPGEGLTGLALREGRGIIEEKGSENPHFKVVPQSGEDKLSSFLAEPIVRGVRPVGVLVLQDEEAARYSKADALALKAIASQLSATLEIAQLLIERPEMNPRIEPSPISIRHIKGSSVSEGIAFGQAYLMEGPGAGSEFMEVCDDKYRDSLEDFRSAIAKTEEQLDKLQTHLDEELADVASLIFSAHLLMLRDEGFSGSMEQLIKGGKPACEAVEQVANEYIRVFSVNDNPRTREKVQDIKDLGHRILKNLIEDDPDEGDYSRQIILTDELLPSELLKLASQNVAGIVLYGGGSTAHITVLARSLQVPLIYTEDDNLFRIPSNTPLALDGFEGLLIIQPDDSSKRRLSQLKSGTNKIESLEKIAKSKTFTRDGKRIYLRATVNLLSDLRLARRLKAEGIGLYRSEFPFLIRSEIPSEEEQFQIYSNVVNGLDDPMVCLRTLDIGGDKTHSYITDGDEANPFLGLRGIRFLMANETIFIDQVKAMIRAGGFKRKIRILFPLISSVDDFRFAKKIVNKSLDILREEGRGNLPVPDLGAMIELPSAVAMVRELASEADFLSIGTNDLIQYMIGVDRTNERVADYFDTRHPAVLRAVKQVALAAEERNCPLNICGIMAKEAQSIYYMIGLGIVEFSLEPARIPDLQRCIAGFDSIKAGDDADLLSRFGTLSEVRTYYQEIKSNRDFMTTLSRSNSLTTRSRL